MATKSKSKIDTVALVLVGIILIGVILAVIGYFVDYVQASGSALGQKIKGDGATIQEMLDSFKNDKAPSAFTTMQVMGIMTLIVSAATLVVALLKQVIKVKLIDFILIICAVIALGMAIGAIATAASFCKQNSIGFMGFVNTKLSLAAGAILVLVGGIISSLSGITLGFKGLATK